MAEKHLPPTARICISSLLALFAVSCSAAPLVQGNVPVNSISTNFDWDAYGLGAGDIIAVNVFGHPEFSTPERGERIDLRGNISIPLIGAVKIDGHTTEAARETITEALGAYIVDASVTVSVVQYGSRQVYLFGQVDLPGAYALDRPINALQALALGRGFRPGADRETVALMRTSGSEIEVHYFNASTPNVDGLVAIQPGDYIFVRQSGTGTFREEVLPYLSGTAPVVGSLTNLLVISEALSDD